MKTRTAKLLILFLVTHLLSTQHIFSQEKTISGTIVDESGMPATGVNIIIKGTSTGSQSDFDGNYFIKANEGQTLIFSYLGMETQEMLIGKSATINIIMKEDAQALDEVVVTAMGIERAEKTLGYAVSTVKSEDFEEARETDVLQALQGKLSGVQITGGGPAEAEV